MIYTGVVEERIKDRFKAGRCRVRVFGVHTENKQDLPTSDLPWAIPLQGITSAAMTGVGYSATGIVEGTWVLIVFADEFNQQPIILGTLGGVPNSLMPSTSSQTIYEPDPLEPPADKPTDTPTETPPAEKPPEPEKTPGKILQPNECKLDSAGEEFIKAEEALSSLTPGKNDFTRNPKAAKLSADTKLYPYKDSKGNWTIGWGSTFMPDLKTKVAADS